MRPAPPENPAPALKLLHVVGVRPNYVKASAVLRAANRLGELENVLIDTGQHYDQNLRDALYRDLELQPPALHLGVGSGTHGQQTAAVLVAFEAALERLRPDGVVVFGDVNSTLASALAATKMGIPMAHVEAGLRCFDRTVPEEINRVIVDSIADLLLAPSQDAVENLRREGAPMDRVHLVGNVMVDSLLQAMPRAIERATCERHGLSPGTYALLTLHRPQNVDHDAPLLRIVEAITALQRDLPVLFSVHPRTANRIAASPAAELLGKLPGLRCVPPLGYLDFLSLQAQAAVVITDSGGVQEETSVLGVPCVTLLERTERPVTISKGTNLPVGTSPTHILAAVRNALQSPRKTASIEGWDGAASERIAQIFVAWLRGGAARRVRGG